MLKRILSLLSAIGLALALNVTSAASLTPAQAASAVADTSSVATTPASNGYAIMLADTEVFRVFTSPVASLTPADRAAIIQKNLLTYASGTAQALRVLTLPEGLGIGDDDATLMVITAQDAAAAGKDIEELANDVLVRSQAAVAYSRTRNTWKTHGIGSALTFFSILGLWLALHWNKMAYVWMIRQLASKRDKWKNGLRVKGAQLISANRIDRLLKFFIKSIRMFIVLLCLYFFLPLILSFFPETRNLGGKIFNYLLTPFATFFNTVINYIPNLFYILVIVIIAYYTTKLIASIFGLIERRELKLDWFYDDWARPTYQIVRFLIIVTALISAYPYIPGSSSEAFQGVGLVLGAIISFASSSAISNIVAGVILTYTRAFRLNDRIKVGDTTGDVVEKTLLVTRIKTIKHVVVTIPNSLVMGAQIVNFSTSAAEGAGVILHTSVTIGYDVPWQTVQSLLIDAALATDKILKHPAPFVLQTSLDDWYVSYEINAYTKQPERMAFIYSDLHRHILEKFDAAGVEIMSPHYYAMRDGNASTVPSALTAEGYRAPPFRVDSGTV